MNQKGAALITALFIMALVAIIAAAMSVRLQIVIKTTELSLNYQQLYLASLGVNDWAKGLLFSDAQVLQQNPSLQNQAIDNLPQSFPPQHYQNILISGSINDEQAKFNINNLRLKNFAKESIAQFILLLRSVDPNLPLSQANKIALAVTTWVSDQDNVTTADIFSSVYTKRNPPYQTPHQPIASISELRLIAGVTPKLYEQLSPYITALPVANTPTLVNVNTAAVPVLMTLGAGMDKTAAQNLIAYRQSRQGFKNPQQFQQYVATQKNLIIPSSDYTLVSNYFLVTSQAKLGDQYLELNSLMQRQIKKNQTNPIQIVINTLWQSQG